jgi:hypothetical protein
MTKRDYFIDFTQQLVIATSTSDASVTIPVDTPISQAAGQAHSSGGSWWLIAVADQDTYLNVGAAATSANFLAPAGWVAAQPYRFAPGTVLHALAKSSTGQVSLVRCRQVD